MNVLNSMDEKLKDLDQFNKELKEFDKVLKDMEEWNDAGRIRMDDLLKPGTTMLPEERVMYTMELQSDISVEIDKHAAHEETWKKLMPTQDNEKSEFAEEFVSRMKSVSEFQNSLMDEVKTEGEKFGEDIKHLADFTSGVKKFEPWIAKSEAKKVQGMAKPKNLQEALDQLADAQKWKEESANMFKILQDANASAQKMTVHDDPDAKHAANIKRWEVIDATSQEWIQKLESMVEVWKKQAETAQKVTAAIAANPEQEGAAPEMKLEDLEKHLENLKQMFIEKQKMMEQLEKEGGGTEAKPEAEKS